MLQCKCCRISLVQVPYVQWVTWMLYSAIGIVRLRRAIKHCGNNLGRLGILMEYLWWNFKLYLTWVIYPLNWKLRWWQEICNCDSSLLHYSAILVRSHSYMHINFRKTSTVLTVLYNLPIFFLVPFLSPPPSLKFLF